MAFTQNAVSKMLQSATEGKSISQVRGKVRIILSAIYSTKNIYINEADAISDQPESAICSPVALERKRTFKFLN